MAVSWQMVLAILIGLMVVAGAGVVVAYHRSARERVSLAGFIREQGEDLVRLPGRLRRVANDPRTPRRARWWLIGLAVFVASPIDPLPDFIPVIGYLDELVVVPLVLIHVRKMIPPEVWASHFPPRVGGLGHPHRYSEHRHTNGGGIPSPQRASGGVAATVSDPSVVTVPKSIAHQRRARS